MALTAFNTLKFFEKLRENEAFTEEQAKAMNEALLETMNTNLVTQADLFKVESEIKSELRLLHWMAGFTLAMVTTLVTALIIKFLIH
jgi:hypothetical protein